MEIDRLKEIVEVNGFEVRQVEKGKGGIRGMDEFLEDFSKDLPKYQRIIIKIESKIIYHFSDLVFRLKNKFKRH